MVKLFAPYEGGMLELTFTFDAIAVGEYRVDRGEQNETPVAGFSMYTQLVSEDDPMDFSAHTGEIQVTRHDSQGFALEFALQNLNGDSLTGRTSIVFD